MAIIRALLGSIILLLDWLTTPRGIKREASAQLAVNEKSQALTLYQYKACPFCVKVRRFMKRQSLSITTKDAKRSEAAKAELLAGGGLLKVPCLRIEDEPGQVQWLYESSEIIDFLGNRFSNPAQTATA